MQLPFARKLARVFLLTDCTPFTRASFSRKRLLLQSKNIIVTAFLLVGKSNAVAPIDESHETTDIAASAKNLVRDRRESQQINATISKAQNKALHDLLDQSPTVDLSPSISNGAVNDGSTRKPEEKPEGKRCIYMQHFSSYTLQSKAKELKQQQSPSRPSSRMAQSYMKRQWHLLTRISQSRRRKVAFVRQYYAQFCLHYCSP